MTGDDSQSHSLNAVIQTPPSGESQLRSYKENVVDDYPHPPNPSFDTLSPAGTSNGTHAPKPMSLPEKHQIALRHIHTIQSHNANLYEDNCRLVNAVNILNGRLAFLGAPKDTQVLRLANMQEKLRVSEAERALINCKYQELLQSSSPGSIQRRISEELQAVRDAYASLDREYHLLRDKYARLKVVTDASRIAQQPSQGTASTHILVVPPNPSRPHDQSRDSRPSAISSGSLLNQKRGYRRRSSEDVGVQPSLRSASTYVSTSWSTPLPTPPPSACLPEGQVPPIRFPVHAPIPAGFLPPLHHSQTIHDLRTLSGLPAVTQSLRSVHQDALEQPGPSMQCSEIADTTNNQLELCSDQILAPASPDSTLCRPKRPNSATQTSMSPDHKKPRLEEEVDHPAIANADTHPTAKARLPQAFVDPHDDCKLPIPDVNARSYQDCVNLIFEKDANVEDGVFCGLCLDRHEAEMIPEPPEILLQPDFDSLARHCMTMHPVVWDHLRRNP